MTTVDENRLKGNFAEYVVASWLSRVALVRPVADGTDVGIDYYCESVIGGTPYLHFWMQVKSIPASCISTEGDKAIAWFDFETKHLQYWARQPIPVYAFLVPTENWTSSFPDRIYGIRVTDHVIRKGIPDKDHVRIKTSDYCDSKSIETDLTQFITQVVPWDTAALLIQKGIVAAIPDGQIDPYKRFPAGIGFNYLPRILENIRDTSVMGLLDSLAAETYLSDKKTMRLRFQAIAELFIDEHELLGLSMLVRAAIIDEDKDKAWAYINKADLLIEKDTRVDVQAKKELLVRLEELRNEVSQLSDAE